MLSGGLSGAQEKRVWDGMLGSEIRAKYFAELSGKYQRKQQLATWGTLSFATADAASFLAHLPEDFLWIRAALAVCAAAVSIYLALAQNERKALDCSDLYARWGRLHKAYEAIWEDIQADDAMSRLRELDEQAIEASKLANSLKYNRKAMRRWQDHTEKEYQAYSA